MQIISGYRNIYTQVDRNAPRVGVGRPHLAPDAGRGASPLTGAGCSGSASGARHALVCDSPRVAGSMGSPARRRAIGSAGERLVHTEEVTGSIPVSPTRSEGMWSFMKIVTGAIPVAKRSAKRYGARHGGQARLGRGQHLLRSLGGVPGSREPPALSRPM